MINIITGFEIITVTFEEYWKRAKEYRTRGWHLEKLSKEDREFYHKLFIDNNYFTVMLVYG